MGLNPTAQRDKATMPKSETIRKARRDARQGKKPTTQAGEFIREEMHKYEEGSGNVRSPQQAIAIGLSEARRAGVKLGAPKGKPRQVRRKAAREEAIARGTKKVSPARSRGARQAARTRERRYHRAVAA
jgi:hypothetical protein